MEHRLQLLILEMPGLSLPCLLDFLYDGDVHPSRFPPRDLYCSLAEQHRELSLFASQVLHPVSIPVVCSPLVHFVEENELFPGWLWFLTIQILSEQKTLQRRRRSFSVLSCSFAMEVRQSFLCPFVLHLVERRQSIFRGTMQRVRGRAGCSSVDSVELGRPGRVLQVQGCPFCLSLVLN